MFVYVNHVVTFAVSRRRSGSDKKCPAERDDAEFYRDIRPGSISPKKPPSSRHLLQRLRPWYNKGSRVGPQ
jgi:hypothetical protein